MQNPNLAAIQAGEKAGLHSLTMSSALGKTFTNGDLFVSVMGLTGSGKSAFISKLTNEPIEIGHDLYSCTKVPSIYTTHSFNKTIHLIDTPGFDDTERPDYEVLVELTTWLNISYNLNIRLSGVIYLHRITDVKFGGAANLNLRTFYQLVGEENMSSVVLATTHWDKAQEGTAERRVLEDREKQLKEDFWAPLIDGGARPRRHENTPQTALTILWEIVAKETTATLKVQKEMNVDQLNLNETSAGREINFELIKQQQKFEKEMKDIQKEMERAAKKQNEKYKAALAAEKVEFQKKLDDNIKMQKKMQQSAQQQMEERKALIEKLSAEVREFRRMRREDQEETSKLRAELKASQKEVEQAIAKASASRPTAGSSSGDSDGGVAAGMAMMIFTQAAVATTLPAVLCNVM